MNSRQRVRAALSGETPDRVPFAFGFFGQSLPGIGDPDSRFGSDVRFAEFDPPREQAGFLDYLERLPADLYLGNPRQLRTYHEWQYHPEQGRQRPLGHISSVAELDAALLPDLSHPQRHAGLARQVRRWHEKGLAVAGSPPHLGGQLFETAWRLRGFETFMEDLLRRPELIHYLVGQLAAVLRQNVAILAKAGVDILLLDDDVAMPTGLLISPGTWRSFFKTPLKAAIDAAREQAPELLVFYHSDGNFTQIIPDLLEIGVNVINPLAPDCMDAAAIRRRFGPRLAFWGTVGRALTWDQGTPRQIAAEVRRRIADLGPSGLLLTPAYDIDFTPKANLAAFAEAVRNSGRATN
jgi:uroporphyrinogen decarboxylase